MTLHRRPTDSGDGSRDRSWWLIGRQFVSYVLLGGVGALSDLALFAALVRLGVTPLQANVVSVATGIGVSFTLNSRFTFARLDHWQRRALRFFTVGVSGLALSSAVLALLIDRFGVAPVPAKLVTLPVVAALQFTLNRSWTFRSMTRPSAAD